MVHRWVAMLFLIWIQSIRGRSSSGKDRRTSFYWGALTVNSRCMKGERLNLDVSCSDKVGEKRIPTIYAVLRDSEA